jgi:hypothetical protein
MMGSTTPMSARGSLERSLAACNLVARAGALLIAALTARTERNKVRKRWVPPLATGLFTLEAAYITRRFARRRTSHDEIAAAMDVLTSLLALLTEAFAHGHRQRPGGPRLGVDYAAGSLTFASSETADPWRLAASALAIGATYSRLVEGSPTARINDLAIITSGIALQPLLARHRHQADHVDFARACALEQAEELATEQERQRQRRFLHDSALQILEAVSGGWQLDDDLLLRRIDFEIERLHRVLASGSPVQAAGLADGLEQLSIELQLNGLDVNLEVSELDSRPIKGPTVSALCDAAQEALVNVRKHSNAARVTIVASSTDDRVAITITDDGCGFDLSASTHGFGIKESIRGRLHDIGGNASIQSSPGHGAHVTLQAPR